MPTSFYDLNLNKNAVNLVIVKAFLGDEDRVSELLDAGGSIEDAVYGFALGGHFKLVNNITDDKPDLKRFAARGYARGNHSEKVAELISDASLLEELLYGHAQAGNSTHVQAALNSRGGAKYLPVILEGLASTEQTELLLHLVKGTRFYTLALQSAAKSGHTDLVQRLFAAQSISLDELKSDATKLNHDIKVVLTYAMQGYIKGRHFEHASELLTIGLNPMHCLNALAKKGVIDANDASRLITAIDSETIQEQVKGLLTEQFAFDLETLDLSMDYSSTTLPGLSDGETESAKLV